MLWLEYEHEGREGPHDGKRGGSNNGEDAEMNGVNDNLTAFLDTVNHRRPARILYHFSCTDDLDRRLKERVGGDGDWFKHYGCFSHHGLSPRVPAGTPRLDFAKYWEKESLPEGSFVNHLGVAEVPSGFYHFTGYVSPLRHARNLREIEEYPVADVTKYDFSHFEGEVRRAHAEGYSASIFVGHMYENAWQIRGYEQFLEDLVEWPEWAESPLERFFQNNLHTAVEAAKAGVDAIYCGDDVASQRNMMFSPSMWRQFMLSRWARVWRAAKSARPDVKIHYHSDGNVMSIIPDLVEAGLDILNPVQPECLDTDEIHRRWGRVLAFDGCMGTQSTMPFGTPQEVRERVRECIEKYGREGGLILSPTHVLEPEVPIANIEAFVDACREYGGSM